MVSSIKGKDIHATGQYFLVVDDHEAILNGTVPALQKAYPQAKIHTAMTYMAALRIAEEFHPELVTIDLGIPETANETATPDVGLKLVKWLLASDWSPNIAVLSTDISPLIRMKSTIKGFEGGFAAIDKSLPFHEMLNRIEFAMRGAVYLPQKVKSRPELHPKWIEMLTLGFEEGLNDKAIAKRMNKTDRTIYNYWTRIQDALLIADDPELDVKMQIRIEAKKMGLLN